MGLSRSCNSVGKNSGIEALENRVEHRLNAGLVDLLIFGAFLIHFVELETLLPVKFSMAHLVGIIDEQLSERALT